MTAPSTDRFSCDNAVAGAAACPCCGASIYAERLRAMLDEAEGLAADPARRPLAACLGGGSMMIDPHAHMISRSTRPGRGPAGPAAS